MRPSQQGQAAPRSPSAGERHKKKADLTNDHTYPAGLPRLPHRPSRLFYVRTRALRTRAQPNPKHWLLCHIGECQSEFARARQSPMLPEITDKARASDHQNYQA